MNNTEIKALISLLDDEDHEVAEHVEQRIRQLGGQMIPFLESEWEGSFNPILQKKIEELIHDLQYQSVLERMREWRQGGSMDLLEGLWIIATYQYPDLSLSKLRQELEQLYYEVWLDLSPEMHPVDQIKTLNNHLRKIFASDWLPVATVQNAARFKIRFYALVGHGSLLPHCQLLRAQVACERRFYRIKNQVV